MFLFLLQFTAGLEQNPTAQISIGFLNDPFFYYIFYIFIIAVIVYAIILILKMVFHKKTELIRNLDKAIFLISVPRKKAKEDNSQPQANTTQKMQEEIALAESFFTSIGGLRAERGVKAFFSGRRDHLSFEIVARNGEIYFYIATPKHLKEYIEQQIHAQYPDAKIEKVDDYNIFAPDHEIKAAALIFTRSYIFPIKTYKKAEVDLMNALMNSLSKLEKEDGAVIQFVVRSAKKKWHKKGKKVASKMQQGKKLEDALREVNSNFILKILYEIANIIKSVKPKNPNEPKDKQKEIHQLSPMENEIIKGLEEKTSKAGMDVNIRVVVSSKDGVKAEMYLANIINAFAQYHVYEYGNGLKQKRVVNKDKFIENFIYRAFDEKKVLILNTEEIVSLYHFPLPSTETPNIFWLRSKGAAAPVNMPKEGILLGENIYRGIKTPVRIARDDRRRHMYIIGVTGSGKSVLMGEMAKQDIANGEGVCIIDPHGSLVEDVLSGIPAERAEDVIIFDPSDTDRPVGLNMLEAKTPEEMDFAIQEMIAIFYKLVTDPNMIGPMFEHNMRNAMLTLMADKENPGTICEIPRIFTDPEFQKYKIAKVVDPMVRAFWEKEMAKTSDFHKSEMLGYLISKVGRFIENEMIRNIIGQPKSGFNFRDIMDKKKILLVNLSKGKIGEVNSDLLGLIIVAKLQMAALSRANIPEDERHDFYLYIDEFQNYVTDSIATILAEARKYRLNLIMAHQYISQLVKNNDTKVRDAVFGNAGTMVVFRIGAEDAEFIAKQFEPVFSQNDLINIEKYHAYVRLLIDNTAARAFEMASIGPTKNDMSIADKIKKLSRLKYGRDKKLITAEILERSKLGDSKTQAGAGEVERRL